MGIEQAIVQENDESTVNKLIKAKTPDAGEKRSCTAIIWLKNDSTDCAKSAIAKTLQTMEGVSAVTYVRHKPCIMMVSYCRAEVEAVKLLSAINIHGGVARIIGC